MILEFMNQQIVLLYSAIVDPLYKLDKFIFFLTS